MKKVLVLLLVLLFTLSTTAFAAISSSGSKSSSSSSSTKSSSTYKPSAPAKSFDEKAPAAQQKPANSQVNQPAAQQHSSTGSFWRNAAWFGGGMLAGSMLSSMFGFHPMGAMADFLGLVLNILFGIALVAAVMWVWRKFRNKDDQKNRKL